MWCDDLYIDSVRSWAGQCVGGLELAEWFRMVVCFSVARFDWARQHLDGIGIGIYTCLGSACG